MADPGVRGVERRAARVLGVVLGVLLSLTGCSSDTSVTPPSPPGETTSGRAGSAQQTLGELQDALAERDESAAAALATPEAGPLLAAMARNAATLDLRDVSLRLVDDQSGLDEQESARFGREAWAATVELTYRLAGWDTQATRVETRVVLAPTGGRQLVAAVGGGDVRTPLWLTGPVTALAENRALVVARSDAAPRYLAYARRALVDVGKVLPRWRGRLVLEAPESEEQLHQALAAPVGQYANIAAVTTTVDGSLVPDSPVHVFLNPRVFDDLGPRGAQVVVSHEATHVATDATLAEVPTWLLEGFADYVALAHAGIPVATAAAQILERVRTQGPPDRLPTAADLDPTASGLGATYEEAWLAARFIAQEHGERRLVAFYRRVSDGTSVAEAFRSVLGTTEAAFVSRWRADLRDLAGGVDG